MQLEKRKSKLTFETASLVRERGKYRAVTVQAEPDFARFKLKGLKGSAAIDVSWEGLYHFAAKVKADRARREKAEAGKKPSLYTNEKIPRKRYRTKTLTF